MREILFRGKQKDYGEWFIGDLMRSYDSKCWIVTHDTEGNYGSEIISETIGQFTGLLDKNGKRIFEGDIVTVCDEITFSPFEFGITGKVVYDECAFFVEPKDVMETQYLFNECAVYEVVGNIHDNPELLKGE